MNNQLGNEKIQELIGKMEDLPAGWCPVEAIYIVKSNTDDDETRWSFRMSDGLSLEEALGALTIQADLIRSDSVHSFEAE